MELTRFGKPERAQFDFAGRRLQAEADRVSGSGGGGGGKVSAMPMPDALTSLSRVWMIGDNPRSDIAGANRAGGPWRSVLTRTGVFTGGANDLLHPANFVFNGVGDAVEYILGLPPPDKD